MGGKGSKAPAPPDYTPIANQSAEAAAMANEQATKQLDWAKQQWAENRELYERVLDVQMPIMESEAAEGQRLRERYNEVFQPIEDALVKEVEDYSSPGRMGFERGRAMADVAQSFEGARKSALARMESYGVDPSQTRAAALDSGIRVQEAAAKAAAGTQAGINTENIGRALRSEAINLGKGLPANIAGAYGTAMSAGQQGFGNALALTGSGAGTMGTGQGWMGTQGQFMGQQAQMLGANYSAQQQAHGAKKEESGQMGSAIGSIAGAVLGSIVAPGIGTALGAGLGGAAGGALAEGGRLPDDPRDPEGKLDTIDAKLSGGEFVIPASAVRRLGSDHFDKIIARFGDDGDREAALSRIKTGKPGGERVSALRRAA